MKTTFTIVSAMCLVGLPATAGTTIPDIQPAAATSSWWWRAALYGWGEALKGDVGARNLAVPVDVSFSQLLDHIDFVAMGAVEVGYGRWGFLADMNYAKLSGAATGAFGGSLEMDLKQFLGSFVITYQAVKTDSLQFDLYAGARVNYLSLDLQAVGPLDRSFSRSGSTTWADPIIGVRFNKELGHDFFIQALGDVGGFCNSDDYTWQAMGGIGYSFHQYGSLVLGYRGIGVNRRSNGFTFDVKMYGPILAYEYRF